MFRCFILRPLNQYSLRRPSQIFPRPSYIGLAPHVRSNSENFAKSGFALKCMLFQFLSLRHHQLARMTMYHLLFYLSFL